MPRRVRREQEAGERQDDGGGDDANLLARDLRQGGWTTKGYGQNTV